MSKKFPQIGSWVKPPKPNSQCCITDNNGNRCPEIATHSINYLDTVIPLCEKCFINYANGAYEPKRKNIQ